jgi:hypothetical protein
VARLADVLCWSELFDPANAKVGDFGLGVLAAHLANIVKRALRPHCAQPPPHHIAVTRCDILVPPLIEVHQGEEPRINLRKVGRKLVLVAGELHAAASTQHSALSTQQGALSKEHSARSTQQGALRITDEFRDINVPKSDYFAWIQETNKKTSMSVLGRIPAKEKGNNICPSPSPSTPPSSPPASPSSPTLAKQRRLSIYLFICLPWAPAAVQETDRSSPLLRCHLF